MRVHGLAGRRSREREQRAGGRASRSHRSAADGEARTASTLRRSTATNWYIPQKITRRRAARPARRGHARDRRSSTRWSRARAPTTAAPTTAWRCSASPVDGHRRRRRRLHLDPGRPDDAQRRPAADARRGRRSGEPGSLLRDGRLPGAPHARARRAACDPASPPTARRGSRNDGGAYGGEHRRSPFDGATGRRRRPSACAPRPTHAREGLHFSRITDVARSSDAGALPRASTRPTSPRASCGAVEGDVTGRLHGSAVSGSTVTIDGRSAFTAPEIAGELDRSTGSSTFAYTGTVTVHADTTGRRSQSATAVADRRSTASSTRTSAAVSGDDSRDGRAARLAGAINAERELQRRRRTTGTLRSRWTSGARGGLVARARGRPTASLVGAATGGSRWPARGSTPLRRASFDVAVERAGGIQPERALADHARQGRPAAQAEFTYIAGRHGESHRARPGRRPGHRRRRARRARARDGRRRRT